MSVHAVVSMVFSGLLAATLFAGDASTYRAFKIGMDVPAVTRITHTDPSQAKTVDRRPALIQQIEWHPDLFGGSPRDEAAKDVLFSFYNGVLYQIVVNYDRYKTEGMNPEDLIEAVSATYGPATLPVAANTPSPDAYASDRSETIKRWGDAECTVSLVRSGYGPSFGLIIVSNRLEPLARAATVEAARLDLQEAPQREIERRLEQAGDERAAQEKARRENKPRFRP